MKEKVNKEIENNRVSRLKSKSSIRKSSSSRDNSFSRKPAATAIINAESEHSTDMDFESDLDTENESVSEKSDYRKKATKYPTVYPLYEKLPDTKNSYRCIRCKNEGVETVYTFFNIKN